MLLLVSIIVYGGEAQLITPEIQQAFKHMTESGLYSDSSETTSKSIQE